jgi:gluconolactonase
MVQFDWDNDRTGFDGDLNTIEMPGDDETELALPAIDGVLAEGAQWEIAWSGPMTADGMSASPQGHLLFAQEQSNAVWRLTPAGAAFVEVPYVLGAGAVSVDSEGRVFAVERACTDPGLNQLACDRPSRVLQLAPERRTVASNFSDGSSLGRLNDIHADGRGGAWVTQGALYHVAADGATTLVYSPTAFTNGVTTSSNGRRLYVTDRTTIVAFDLDAEGGASNQRTFATLSADIEGFGGDGMEVDAGGRLYVTGHAGVYVFAPDGAQLGIIPVPRRAITLAFAGADRRTLYVGAMGARTPEGADWATPEGVRNVAMTVYKLPMLSAGVGAP